MLNGNLREFPLLAVLQALMASGRSGLLTLDATPSGQVALHGGEVRAARCLGVQGLSALELMCWGQGGRFRFELTDQPMPAEISPTLGRDTLLRALFAGQQAWEGAGIGAIDLVLEPWERGPAWDDNALVSGHEFRALEGGFRDGLTGALQSGATPAQVLAWLQAHHREGRLQLQGDSDLL